MEKTLPFHKDNYKELHMKQMKTTSLQARFILISITAISIILGLLAVYRISTVQAEGIAKLNNDSQAVLGRLETSLANALWSFDQKSAETMIISEMKSGFIVGVIVNAANSGGDKLFTAMELKGDTPTVQE